MALGKIKKSGTDEEGLMWYRISRGRYLHYRPNKCGHMQFYDGVKARFQYEKRSDEPTFSLSIGTDEKSTQFTKKKCRYIYIYIK